MVIYSERTGDEITSRPRGYVERVQHCDKRETPGDAFNDCAMALFRELVDDSTE